MLSLIILAAGKSTRMLGRNKLLEKFQGKPIIRRVVEVALKSKIDEIVVVLGWEANLIREALTDLPCRLVVNQEFEQGQSSSLKVGLKEVSQISRAVLVLPGDMALIDSRTIDKVVDAYNAEGGTLVIAAHKGKQGHPILLDRRLFPEIERIREENHGLKAVVRKHEPEIRLVETGTANVLKDVDTPFDLREISQG
jgi:molybdenum cofactor cytidylyltransferase